MTTALPLKKSILDPVISVKFCLSAQMVPSHYSGISWPVVGDRLRTCRA